MYISRTLSKAGFIASAKNVSPGQPAQSAQADLSRHFLLLAHFLHVKGTLFPYDLDRCWI